MGLHWRMHDERQRETMRNELRVTIVHNPGIEKLLRLRNHLRSMRSRPRRHADHRHMLLPLAAMNVQDRCARLGVLALLPKGAGP